MPQRPPNSGSPRSNMILPYETCPIRAAVRLLSGGHEPHFQSRRLSSASLALYDTHTSQPDDQDVTWFVYYVCSDQLRYRNDLSMSTVRHKTLSFREDLQDLLLNFGSLSNFSACHNGEEQDSDQDLGVHAEGCRCLLSVDHREAFTTLRRVFVSDLRLEA